MDSNCVANSSLSCLRETACAQSSHHRLHTRQGNFSHRSPCAGIVLAMQPCPDKAVSPEQVRSMLAVFGPIAWSCAIDPLPTGPPLPITAFEFYCLQDARQAVSALNYGAKNAFCLCQLNKRGHIVPSDTNCGSACRFSGCNTPPGFSQVIPAIPTTLSARTDELVSDSINNPVSDPMSLHSADRPLASAGAAVLSPTLYPTAHSSGMPQHQHCATAPRALSGPSLGQHGAHQHRTASSLPQHLSHNACSAPPDQAMPFVYPDTQHARDALLSILGSYHTPTSNPGSAQASPTPAAVAFSQAAASGAPSAIQSPMNSASLAASLPPSVAASLCGGGNLADPAADFLTEFDPTEAAAGGPRARTTVMIRNIPCRWTAEDLLAVLSGVIGHSWDLLYMPCKNSDVAHAGYAFMNFRAPQDTLGLFNAMHGRCWPNTRSSKICEVRYARIQGRHLLTHLFSHGAPGSTAAAFRGYLAFPANGSVIVHGPNSCVSRSHSKRSKRQGSSRGSRKGAAARSTVCVPHPADAIASMPAPVTWMHQQQSQPQAAHQSVQQQLPMAACGDTSNVWGAALPQMQGQQQQQMGRQHMLPVQNVQRHPRSMPHVMHDNNAAELNSMFSTLPMPQALHHPVRFRMLHVISSLCMHAD